VGFGELNDNPIKGPIIFMRLVGNSPRLSLCVKIIYISLKSKISYSKAKICKQVCYQINET
jgi:hypothetical protein